MLDENEPDGAYHDLLLARLTRQLVSVATMSCKTNPRLIRPHRKAAQRELRKRFLSIMKCGNCSVTVKAMAVWAAVMPIAYQAIHSLYAKCTGLDKKYSTDK